MAKKPTTTLTLDVFRAENKNNTPICALATFLKTLSAKDRAAVMAAVKDLTIQSTAIARVLRPLGYTYTYQVIARHRRTVCSVCGPVV